MSRSNWSSWYTDKTCSCGGKIATNGREEWCVDCQSFIDVLKESNKKHKEMFKKLAE